MQQSENLPLKSLFLQEDIGMYLCRSVISFLFKCLFFTIYILIARNVFHSHMVFNQAIVIALIASISNRRAITIDPEKIIFGRQLLLWAGLNKYMFKKKRFDMQAIKSAVIDKTTFKPSLNLKLVDGTHYRLYINTARDSADIIQQELQSMISA